MATEEHNVPPPPPPTQLSTMIPDYSELILAAIEALDEKSGSNKSSISKHIEITVGSDLPAAHTTLLSHHLNKLKQSGQLVMLKNNYMKPDPNAPPKRGRGRPPKPKVPLPAGAVISPPRPRGRPPKPKDPLAPPPPPKTAASSSSGGGGRRGRPPKKAKSEATPPPPPPPSGAPRGRGRPPKVKPPMAAPVGA